MDSGGETRDRDTIHEKEMRKRMKGKERKEKHDGTNKNK
jgi:hypothetical protein